MATDSHNRFLAYRVMLGTDSDLEKMRFGFQPMFDHFYVEWSLSRTLRINMEFGGHIPAHAFSFAYGSRPQHLKNRVLCFNRRMTIFQHGWF